MKERTATNVHAAFVGESKAYQRLLEYAKKAVEEGFPQIAHLFRAVAASESVHARRHFRLLEAVLDSQSNMEYAFQQENAVNGNHYQRMIQEAEEDGEKAAALVFSQARDVEGVHAKLYRRALDHMVEEIATEYYACEVCGYLHEKEPPDKCPVCGAPKDRFFKVD
jgi:rubrerythrin